MDVLAFRKGAFREGGFGRPEAPPLGGNEARFMTLWLSNPCQGFLEADTAVALRGAMQKPLALGAHPSNVWFPLSVIPGLDPGIHRAGGTMDARIKSGHDSVA